MSPLYLCSVINSKYLYIINLKQLNNYYLLMMLIAGLPRGNKMWQKIRFVSSFIPHFRLASGLHPVLCKCNNHCNFFKSCNFGDNMILDVKLNIILFNRYSWSVMKRKPHFESKIKKFSIYKFFENFKFFIFFRNIYAEMVDLIIISFTFRYILDTWKYM